MKEFFGSVITLIILVAVISCSYFAGFSDGQKNLNDRIEVQFPARIVEITSSDLKVEDKSFYYPNGTKGKLIIKIELKSLGGMLRGHTLKKNQRWIK